MIMWRSESSPRSAYSASASANSLRMFSSDCPTYLDSTSGPFTIFGSLPFSILPIWRAINVLPVPGGPKSSMPFTWFTPSFLTTAAGKMREANARRKMSENSLSRPPERDAHLEKLKSCLKIVLRLCDSRPVKAIGEPCARESWICVCGLSMPRWTEPPSAPPLALSTTSASSGPTFSSRLWPWKSATNCWPTVRYWRE